MAIDYSFIILCYNQRQHVKLTLETLLNTIKHLSNKKQVEIIVVDNGSEENLGEIVSQLNAKQEVMLCYYRLEENMGYPVGMNIGISRSKGNVVILLNSDLIFSGGWLSPLLQTLKRNKNIGVVAPYLSNATGLQHIGFYETDQLKIDKYAKNFIASRTSKITLVDRVIGACMIINKAVIDKIGGNDFWFGAGYYDDDDWCKRIKHAGYLIAVQNNSFVYHIGGGSFGSAKMNLQQLIHCNKEKFHTKWDIQNMESIKDIHASLYIPIEKSYYDKVADKYPKMEDYLIVADWLNEDSKWREKVEKLLNKRDQAHYCAWQPKNYYKNFFNNQRRLKWMTEAIPHCQLLQFISGFKGVVAIEDDFVNRYIIYLAKGINMNVI